MAEKNENIIKHQEYRMSWKELGGKNGTSLNSLEFEARLKFKKNLVFKSEDRYYVYFEEK
ncbi:hypothetical protein [Lactococcus protaetiae]|uniref:Uncharacterized protein n=1 Tax=Lactococcus protaetiae TaxID=2592653 RepID=A0A514ZA33_9LACT|nr:hypothetical protein [Lactococcus protaetiae]QDK71446.1 hypothetical protein FLP15_10100 [Lactococcus protaetiae]